MALGRGGLGRVARASGVMRQRIARGVAELENGAKPTPREREKGGGRKNYRDTQPELVAEVLKLVAPETRGDPMSPLLWTNKSTRKIAATLQAMGYNVSHDTVSNILREDGYSLQANVKTKEGNQHADRDEQFREINRQVEECLRVGIPVLSMDCKKKENIGEFKNGGQEWAPKGRPVEAKVHDFKDNELGKAIPYGLYDVGRNQGWVHVGIDHDTAEFAVNTVRNWYQSEHRRQAYPNITEIYMCLDGGGSNNWRSRLWKEALVNFAQETGLTIRVSHLPPGTSKWNKIEHRLFSHITMNWRGRPLTSLEVVVETIKATTTKSGLTVHAQIDPAKYETGKKISDETLARINQFIVRNAFHGEWNYTIVPAPVPES